MNVITILLDSLNRDFLPCYGNSWVQAPNIQRLADKGFVFDNHFIGSAPCIPARRELFTGRKEFLWRGWGQTEPFDDLLAVEARKAGAFTAVVTDHYHYWNANEGYGYIKDFQYSSLLRGTENDSYGDSDITGESYPQWIQSIAKYRPKPAVEGFFRNVKNMEKEEDFQSPRVMASACNWLSKNHKRDKFFLHIESFDPHEPFHVPEPYRSMYGPYREDMTCWPPYQRAEDSKRFVEEQLPGETDFVISQYAGKITMADRHLGKVLDMLDEKDLWKDTMVILTTDHGHEMFEKERYGKSYPNYNTTANIPLIIWHPQYPGNGERIGAMTTTVDIYATVLDALSQGEPTAPHGRSLLPLLRGECQTHRDHVTFGVFGRGVGVYDGEHTFFSGYDNAKPLNWYSTHLRKGGVGCELESMDWRNATGDKYIPGVDCPVWQIPCQGINTSQKPLLFAAEDREQVHDLAEEQPIKVAEYEKKLYYWLKEEGAPSEQFQRLLLEP